MDSLGLTLVRAGDFLKFFTKKSLVLGFRSVESRTSGEISLFFLHGNIHTSGIFFV